MRSSPSRDARAAYLLADLASAHDAGLSTDDILHGAATASLTGSVGASESLADGLAHKGLELAPHELLMLRTAEQSGNLSRALRNLAEQRGARATRSREIRRRLAYPTLLLAMGFVVSLFASAVTRSPIWIPIAVFAGVVGGIFLAVRLAIHSAHDADARRLPMISDLVREVGELPYLQAMHGLYGAGVKLAEAHDLALRTSPIEGVRVQLFTAGQALSRGHGYTDALDEAGALHPETRQMLAAAEASGDLEGALGRAIERRQTSVDLQSRRLTSIAIVILSVMVYGYVGYVIISFYTNLYSGILGR